MNTVRDALMNVIDNAPVSFFENLTEAEAFELHSVARAIDETLGTSVFAAEIRNAILENTNYDVA